MCATLPADSVEGAPLRLMVIRHVVRLLVGKVRCYPAVRACCLRVSFKGLPVCPAYLAPGIAACISLRSM